jgi:hypothetical protein
MITPEETTNVTQIAPGVFVDDDVLGIVDWIREYDPQLDVLYLDPARHDLAPDDPPYKIVEKCRDGLTRIVLSCWTLDATVKERIYRADNQRHNVLLTLDQHNAKVKDDQTRRFNEERERDADLIGHILKNPRTTYTFCNDKGELIRLEDDYGVVRRKT